MVRTTVLAFAVLSSTLACEPPGSSGDGTSGGPAFAAPGTSGACSYVRNDVADCAGIGNSHELTPECREQVDCTHLPTDYTVAGGCEYRTYFTNVVPVHSCTDPQPRTACVYEESVTVECYDATFFTEPWLGCRANSDCRDVQNRDEDSACLYHHRYALTRVVESCESAGLEQDHFGPGAGGSAGIAGAGEVAAGGSAGATGWAGGAGSAGASGDAQGGSAGAPSGGSAGAPWGGSAGAAWGGSAGASGGGSVGAGWAAAAGSAGAP